MSRDLKTLGRCDRMNDFLEKYYDIIDKVQYAIEEEMCLYYRYVELRVTETLENDGLICETNKQNSEIKHELLENVQYVFQRCVLEDYWEGRLAIKIKDTDYCICVDYTT